MTPTEFRTMFPAFDATAYPDVTVQLWIDLAAKMLPENRWADLLSHGTGLFVAHYLTVNGKAAKGKGATQGPIASKSVDKVSVSYDTGVSTLEGGGHWNASVYGQQFLQLARMVGAGGVQL